MAGFALYKRYKSQFFKMLKIISDNFLVDLKSHTAPELNYVELQTCIEEKKFLSSAKRKEHAVKTVIKGDTTIYARGWRLVYTTLTICIPYIFLSMLLIIYLGLRREFDRISANEGKHKNLCQFSSIYWRIGPILVSFSSCCLHC